MSRRDPRRGVELLAVIALTAVASLAVGVGAIAAQTQAISVRAAVNQAQMRATFDAALTTAIYQMLTSDAPSLSPDGRLSRWTMAEAAIDLRIVAEAGRLDLNQAPGAQFEALVRALGANATSAQRLAKHYSSARGTVRDPVEVRAWPGMSATLFEAMAPYLTVHGETAARADLSPGALLTARAPLDGSDIRAARAEGLPAPAERLTRYALFLDVAAPNGARRAEMVVIATPGREGPYEILSRRRLKVGAVAALFPED
jgi:type II secretory pathway component PulK